MRSRRATLRDHPGRGPGDESIARPSLRVAIASSVRVGEPVRGLRPLTISIRQGFLAIGVSVVALLAAIIYLMTLEVQNQSDLAAAEMRRHASYKLADELRQTSDDLTRMARTYVVTGDPVYEDHFERILGIRNGLMPRPVDYDGIYWDFVTATGERPGVDGDPVALQALMRAAEFTEPEFARLRESQRKSDALVQLEERAMSAVKGFYADSEGSYTVRGDPDLALARELLHGPDYHSAKGAIMTPIAEFMNMVEERTAEELAVLRARARLLAWTALGLVILAVGLLMTGFALLQRRVDQPVRELAKAAARAESGDYGARVVVRADDEVGQLASAFNQMSSAIESDIEARMRASEELAEARRAADSANRAKSTFLANMSHELRTPMNAIIGYSEMLMEDAEEQGDEDAVGDLSKIRSAGKHLLALINDVLDLSKIEAGKMDLFLESFEIAPMVSEVVDTAEPLVEENDNRLEVDVDPSLGEMYADQTKVRQTLLNLLSNAAKFTHDGRIVLTVRATDEAGAEGVLMSIRDSGIGIPSEKLEHVFGEFAQAEDDTTRQFGGTGLGLSISRRFCRMMGGDISVQSMPGEGSTFTIRLPLRVATEDEPAQPSTSGAPSVGTERVVLVIDDDPNALDLLGRTFQRAGVRVVTASDGREALRLARSLRPAAITLDVMMPEMDGWDVLRELKSDPTTRDIPVIMVTMTDDRSRGYALGATEFLTKPVQRAELVGILDRYAQTDDARRALVVDDLAENREMLRRRLEAEGWQVSEAENGRVALERVAREEPSLILLDLMMPVMDGFEFVMEMRKREPASSIPIVVVTAKEITEEDRQRLNGGVVGLIEKAGLEPESLFRMLESQLAAAEGERSSRHREPS